MPKLFLGPECDDARNAGQVRLETSDDGHDAYDHWGEILVPENRRRPGSKLISLRFRRAGRRGAPPLLVFGGGPGISNFRQKVPGSIASRYDVVWVGYRGIDSSRRLECAALKVALTSKSFGSREALGTLAREFRECIDAWRRSGIDLQGYQLRDVADDAEDVRRALDLGPVHVLAVSYGTRVALTFETVHPQSVRRAVLVGANPPGHFFWSAEDVHRGFEAYQPFFEQAQPRYKGAITLEALCAEVLARIERGEAGGKLDAGRASAVSFLLLFHQSTSVWVFDAFLRAYEERDYRGLELMSSLYDLVLPRMFEWGDFTMKGLVSDWEPDRDYVAEAARGPGRFGSPFGTVFFGPPYPRETLEFRDPPLALDVRSPTLILSGALDFSTPAAAGRELVERFPNAVRQWTAPDRGHVGDFWRESDALASILVGFYEAGEAPLRNPFSTRHVEFRKSFGLGHLKGAALVVIGAILLGGVALLLL